MAAMELIVAGDWHGNTRAVERALREVSRAGHTQIYQLGDLGVLWGRLRERDRFTVVLLKFLERFDLALTFIDGNHDNVPALRDLPRNTDGFGIISDRLLHAPRGHRWTLEDGTRFGALGGAYSVDRAWREWGKDLFEGEEVTSADVDALGSEPLDVLLCHEVPAGVPVISQLGDPLAEEEAWTAYQGRLLVEQGVRNTSPCVTLCGHWHQRLTADLTSSTRVEVLNRDNQPGNLVVLNTADLSVTEFPIKPL
ncbi:metallophosphoesterase family protein [Specibacter sp. RAF43]|uniref:metallophosphoesterase family protein n=1 Tax=Specibacter sp. RAF43 TaxID=3233057 RepID=UPI003F9C1CB5